MKNQVFIDLTALAIGYFVLEDYILLINNNQTSI